MTRATLLSLLAYPTALAGPDVRALEELAQAFPYCQTAHLLLAKAAHDQDSMLAAQRLRRAATYAADRVLLRQLIETPAPTSIAVLQEVESPLPDPVLASELSDSHAAISTSANSTLALIAQEQDTDYSSVISLEDKPDQVIGLIENNFLTVVDNAAAAPAVPPATELAEPAMPAKIVAESISVEVASAPAQVAETQHSAGANPTSETAESTATEIAAELPAQAPLIRPPAEAEAARFEFGLATKEPAEIIAYRLPELEEISPAITPKLLPFSGVADVGYASGEGSRLGFCLVTTVPAAEWEMPGSTLPPAEEFFAPDALLLDYLATAQPLVPPKPSPFDLINSFLQRAPIASRRRAMPTPAMPDTEAQADLSLSSTRAEPDLASENLARILARQGKNERAIAVYERLMVKHPEKMAYFAAQIESLRPLA